MGPIRNPRWKQKRTDGYVIVSSVNDESCVYTNKYMLKFCYFVREHDHKAVNKTFRSYSVTTNIINVVQLSYIQSNHAFSKSVGPTICHRVNPSVRVVNLIRGKLSYNYCEGVIILLRVIQENDLSEFKITRFDCIYN